MIDRPTPETKSFYVTAFDVEEWAEKCIRLEKERDEARDAIVGWENKWKFAIDMAARAELERDDALNKLNDLKDILR